MTREEQIIEEANKASELFYKMNDNYGDCVHGGFIDGARWADEHPDSTHIYTKKQLLDMGFAFTTNGDIVTPDQYNEDLKKYLQYQKQKFIKKAREWLSNNKDSYIIDIEGETLINDQMIKDFCKVMEE